MGVWSWLKRAAVALKRCKPPVKPVTDMCRNVSRAAKDQVDGAVRTKARVFYDLFYDDQIRDHLSHLIRHFSKNGALFIVRSYGGGPIIDIVSQSLQDRKANAQLERLEELELKVAKLEWALRSREHLRRAAISGAYVAPKYRKKYSFNSDLNKKHDEILRIFLMKILAMKVLDDLMVPSARSKRNVKPVSGIDRQNSHRQYK